ncbi:MFS transporter [Paramicrobacterium agarici]|uniref:Putative MFS family arabinose efflux permease n=1 Tax=Paramicrobacterium agarici TaxID=630514 RepID=A0A2A9DU16_9MICO|nr:MFS transporter [Microbacterium agarici]PFG29856.1 putative MFS family arabinose efflux permease [Microbacterium agarici]
MANTAQPQARGLRAIPAKDRRTVAGGAIGTMMEYYDYYLFGLGAAVVFPHVFFPGDDPVMGMLQSFATFAVGFLLRPLGGIVFGYVGDRFGRKRSLMVTVIGMGICTTLMGLIPSAESIGLLAPILLVFLRMCQGLFVGGEMGPAATIVVEYAPTGRRGLFGALLITGAGVANVFSAGLMAVLGAGDESFFMTWGWRIPFLFAAVLTIVAIILRSKLEESDEFKSYTKTIEVEGVKRKNPLMEAIRHPKNLILGIFIGLPQSIAGYIVLTYGLAYMVQQHSVDPEVGFIGTMIVGFLQIVMAPVWGHVSDKIGRRRFYILACIGFAVLIYPAFALFSGGTAILIWLGMIVGFVIPGVAMQGTLQTLLTEMFDVEARTTGVNVGYQFSNTLGGGFAPLICAALFAWAGHIWPVIVYATVIALAGVIATAYASIRPDTEDAGRLHELN